MKIAIVGAAGKLGSWFATLLHQHGHELVLVGRRREPLELLATRMDRCVVGQLEDLASTDLVIVSVPMDVVERVIAELGLHVRESQPVIDLSSLKRAPQGAADAHMAHACFLGVHPMFGSGAESLSGHNVILVPDNPSAEALATKVREYVEPLGAHVVSMDVETHDDLMSVVLGLPALVVAAVARSVLAGGRFGMAREVSGTSLEVLASLTESMLCEGSELYGTLLAALPSASEVAGALQDSAAHFARLVETRDRTALIEEFSSLGRQLEQVDHRAGDAYARMYAMLEALKRYPPTPASSSMEAGLLPPADC